MFCKSPKIPFFENTRMEGEPVLKLVPHAMTYWEISELSTGMLWPGCQAYRTWDTFDTDTEDKVLLGDLILHADHTISLTGVWQGKAIRLYSHSRHFRAGALLCPNL